MVSDQEIASCVESLLRSSSSSSSSAAAAAVGGAVASAAAGSALSLGAVVRHVEAKLGLDLSHKAVFIQDQIDLLLGPRRHLPPAPSPNPPPHPSPPPSQPHFLFHQMPPSSSSSSSAAAAAAGGVGGGPYQYPYPAPPPLPAAAVVAAYHLQQQLQQPQPQPQQPQLQPQPPPFAAAAIRPAAPRESASTGAKRRAGAGGLNKVCGVSPKLQAVVGEAAMPRTEIVRQLWAYIRKNNLQDPSNKRKIICNDELRAVFETDCTDMFKMNKLLSKHITALDPKDGAPDFKRLKAVDVSDTKVDSGQFLVIISDALAKFFGTQEREMLQADALRRVGDYINANKLEDARSKSILCDSKLQQVFGVESIPSAVLPEMLAQHLTKKS